MCEFVRLLTERRSGELATARGEMVRLATEARSSVTRQLGYVALIAADGDTEKTWDLGTKSLAALQDFLEGGPLLRDPGSRASLYPKVEPPLDPLAPPLGG